VTDTPTPERGASVEIEPQSSFLRPQDFSEDFSHENGNYQCRCYRCGHTFVGHKRRVTCKLCVTIDALTYERDALAAECARKDAEIAALDAWFKAHPDQYGEDGWIMYDSAQRLIIARQYGFDDISAQSVAELIPLLNPGAPRDGE